MSNSLKRDVIKAVRKRTHKHNNYKHTLDNNYNGEDIDWNQIPYCENPAIGMGAPNCSKDCCCYGGCNKKAYFEYIANKYNTTPDKIAIGTNFQFDKFVIDDREYSNEEVLEILKKHKEEEDKKYHKCYRCSKKYLENNKFNMVNYNLNIEPDNAYAVGYAHPPYIKGFRILSTCGKGKDIGLCDDCINELLKWLNINDLR